MKLILEPTGIIENVNGTPARVWHGKTDLGVEVKAWIATVQPQTDDPAALAAFDAELRQVQAERQLVTFDMRMVL